MFFLYSTLISGDFGASSRFFLVSFFFLPTSPQLGDVFFFLMVSAPTPSTGYFSSDPLWNPSTTPPQFWFPKVLPKGFSLSRISAAFLLFCLDLLSHNQDSLGASLMVS